METIRKARDITFRASDIDVERWRKGTEEYYDYISDVLDGTLDIYNIQEVFNTAVIPLYLLEKLKDNVKDPSSELEYGLTNAWILAKYYDRFVNHLLALCLEEYVQENRKN